MHAFGSFLLILSTLIGVLMIALGIGADAMSDSPYNHSGRVIAFAGFGVIVLGIIAFATLR